MRDERVYFLWKKLWNFIILNQQEQLFETKMTMRSSLGLAVAFCVPKFDSILGVNFDSIISNLRGDHLHWTVFHHHSLMHSSNTRTHTHSHTRCQWYFCGSSHVPSNYIIIRSINRSKMLNMYWTMFGMFIKVLHLFENCSPFYAKMVHENEDATKWFIIVNGGEWEAFIVCSSVHHEMCFFLYNFICLPSQTNSLKTYDGYKVCKVTNLIKSSAQHYSLFGIIDFNLITEMWRIDLWIDSSSPSPLPIIMGIVNGSQCCYPFFVNNILLSLSIGRLFVGLKNLNAD